MAPRQSDELDRQVRESFGIGPDSVRRVVDGAQAAAAIPPRRARALGVGVVATAGVLALSAAVLWWPRARTVPAPAESVVSGSLTDGILVLTWPDGSASILGPDRGAERPPDGFGIVLIDGEGDRQ